MQSHKRKGVGPGRGGELGSITQSTMSTYDMPGGVDTGDADLNKTLALPLEPMGSWKSQRWLLEFE